MSVRAQAIPFLLLCSVLFSTKEGKAQSGTGIRVLTPLSGTRLLPGQSYRIDLEVLDRGKHALVAVIGEGPLGLAEFIPSSQFMTFNLTISPKATPGRYALAVMSKASSSEAAKWALDPIELTSYARKRMTAKRGGGMERAPLFEGSITDVLSIEEVIAIDMELKRLAELDKRVAEVVELRVFAGLSEEETAAVMGISATTVAREWKFARTWLFDRLRLV